MTDTRHCRIIDHMPTTDDTIIGSAEAAEILGKNQRTVQRMVESGRLPTVAQLPGKRTTYLFRRTDVEAVKAGEAA